MKKSYETVFILTPILTELQAKDTVTKFTKVLTDQGADVVNVEEWGLRKLAYTIDHKTTGYYIYIEFNAATTVVATLETEFRRDENIIRFLTTSLDKFALEYNDKRRSGKFKKQNPETTTAV